jgi:hypothetical protein
MEYFNLEKWTSEHVNRYKMEALQELKLKSEHTV